MARIWEVAVPGTFTLSAATMEKRVESPFNLKYPSSVYNEDKAATNKKRKDVTRGRGITSSLPTLLLKRYVEKSPLFYDLRKITLISW